MKERTRRVVVLLVGVALAGIVAGATQTVLLDAGVPDRRAGSYGVVLGLSLSMPALLASFRADEPASFRPLVVVPTVLGALVVGLVGALALLRFTGGTVAPFAGGAAAAYLGGGLARSWALGRTADDED